MFDRICDSHIDVSESRTTLSLTFMIFIKTIPDCLHANTSPVIFVALNSVFVVNIGVNAMNL